MITRRAGVCLDVDGTLVDSTFQHALCWHHAFAQHGIVRPVAEMHAHVGMGGDQLVPAIAGPDVEEEHGDAIRAAHDALFGPMLPTIRPLDGARRLLEALAERHQPVVLCSSAGEDEIAHYVDLLEARDLVRGWTTSDDVARTKPHGDLVRVALRMLGAPRAVMIGDSPWDVRAATAAGIPTIGVDTGGFGEHALREAGARIVVGSMHDLLDRVNCEPFVVWRGGAALTAVERAGS